ncbi:MAG: diguanylate cyclase [Chloroflexi bacterium]|jgi:diguanylate cyclase (GGDEF)-like protein/PAS domain S-box-containing protein/putative nucleotidyltransferase with HDIG domain|nr:diguanylate cyclase [Chloroflexota bacterium]
MSKPTHKAELEGSLRPVELFETLLRAVADGIVITDSNQNIIMANKAFSEFFDQGVQDVKGTNLSVWLKQLGDNAPKTWEQLEEQVKRNGACSNTNFQMSEKIGPKHFSVNASRMEKVIDEESGIISIWRNVTDSVCAEEALKNSEERFRSLVENAPDIVMNVDSDGIIQFINRTPPRISIHDAIGKSVLDFTADEHHDMVKKIHERVLKTGVPEKYETYGKITGNYYSSRVGAISRDNHSVGLTIITRDITESKKTEETLRNQSVTDDLTGLYNRRHFYDMLDREIDRMRRYGGFLSLVMIDLDGFKEYNDRLGHLNGDMVLKLFAQTAKVAMRKNDMLFRYGGDEFVMILPSTESDRARKVIERIKRKWQFTIEIKALNTQVPITFGAGIAQFPKDGETADGLVFLADSALYYSKGGGESAAILVSDLSFVSTDAIEKGRMDQVYALAATVDAKDPYTYGHSRRVAELAEKVGKVIDLTQHELLVLHSAALLHDIGKVGIPDAVLSKSGKPTKEEWEAIRGHSSEGANIVGHVKELQETVPMIMHHHEWYDGTGYPGELEGDQIPLGARLISIADAYDSMTTERRYKNTVPSKRAIEELRRYSGTQFDPELVEIFCQAIQGTILWVKS